MKNSVLMTFVNGPLHRQQMEMKWIPQVQIITDLRDRRILLYVRDETTYYYEADLSAKLTAVFDDVAGQFKENPVMPMGEIKKLLDTAE